MINVSPVGRNASTEERNAYEKYDKQHQIRAHFVEALKARFGDLGLTYVGSSVFQTHRLISAIVAIQLEDKFPSMYFLLVGTRLTVCNT